MPGLARHGRPVLDDRFMPSRLLLDPDTSTDDRHFYAKSIVYRSIAETGSRSSQLRRSGAKSSPARAS